MTQPVLLSVLAVLGVLVVALVATALIDVRAMRRLRAEVRSARLDATDLRRRLEQIEARPPVAGEPGSWVITEVGSGSVEPDVPEPAPMDGRLFADTVLRETVVKAAGLGHGVRRALAPEVRDQIRREMRREVRRARKQRKDDGKAARRAGRAAERRHQPA